MVGVYLSLAPHDLRAAEGLSPGPPGSLLDNDYRVPLTWIDGDGEYGAGDYGRRMEVGDRKRYYEMHVPKNYRKGKPLPVVLVLHGGGGFAAFMRYQTGMDEVADKENFIAVYPAGTHQFFSDRLLFWNAGVPPKNVKQQKVDDVAYITAVLDDVAKHFSVDAKRVYACGMSNGAHMCFLLAAKLPDRIAAIGPVAGQRAVGQYAPEPTRPIPLIYFHGAKDTWASFAGGESSPVRSAFEAFEIKPAREAVASWAKFNGCDAKAKETVKGEAHQFAYPSCKKGGEVVYWQLEDGGHTWPGGKRSKVEERGGVGEVNADINASQLMWEFFKQHSLE
jgi:polyhydroxybutyrate depolymerase